MVSLIMQGPKNFGKNLMLCFGRPYKKAWQQDVNQSGLMSDILDFLLKRRSTLAIMLEDPGPTEDEVELILTAGSRVPDHGKLVPWRFILFTGVARETIGETFATEFSAANPNATADQIETERRLFLRAPLVIGVVSTATAHIKVPEWEQRLTAGAVCQNILHAAGALGYGAQWLTQWISYNDEVRRLVGVRESEQIAGFIYIGTSHTVPSERPRPDIAEITQLWSDSAVDAEMDA